MDCDECEPCHLMRQINGAIGSNDCLRTVKEIKKMLRIINTQSHALNRLRILQEHPDRKYALEETVKVLERVNDERRS